MKSRFVKYALCCVLLLSVGRVQAQNNPYVDEKLLHFGFFLGLDFLSYNIVEQDTAIQMEMPKYDGHIYHPRTSAPGLGFSVGFITDLRLTEHLNLRFTPALSFGERRVSYYSSPTYITDSTWLKTNILTIPISIPLYLKWSADRIYNFRPYMVVGGGVQLECFRDKEKPILHTPLDAFISAGFGCDLYFRWFKLCPEIKYQIGFIDAHTPTSKAQDQGWQLTFDPNNRMGNYFYSDAIKRMTHQKISLIFNIE